MNFWIILGIAVISIIGMFICILKFPSLKLKKLTIDTFFIPILLGAIILLALPLFDRTSVFNVLFSNSALNPLKILVLFICISILSISLDESGFFKYIATIFIKKYNKSQMMLFIVLYLLISFLTIFTSNDIVILTFTPFILYFSKKGHINPIPYLIMEFVAANTYSMILAIGNPTNIFLSSAFNISFLNYFIKMIIPALFAGIFSFIALIILFHKDLKKEINIFDLDDPKIENKAICITSGIHLILCTILLAISNYISLEMWLICLIFASSLLIFLISYSIKTKQKKYLKGTLRRIPYSLIPFVLSMFIIIMALTDVGLFKIIRGWFDEISNDYLKSLTYLVSSTLSCNIMNNIPMTLAYSAILDGSTNLKLVYSTIIGSNIGAILTPVGALAGIMWIRLLKINDIKYSFLDFIKNGSFILLFILAGEALALLI